MSGILILQPFANSGDKATPPQTDSSGFVNWLNGYTADYEIQLGIGNPQAKAVERPIQNALFNLITTNIQSWQQYGFSQWYNTMPGGYDFNAMVIRQKAGVWTPYRSLVTNNVDDPLTTPASWEYIPYSHESLLSVPMPSGGASGPSSEIVTIATDFNSFGTGTWQFKTDAVASGSAHAPAPPGGVTTAGLLESMIWSNGTTNFGAQRYLDRAGNSFFRGSNSGTWTAWASTTAAPTYSLDTSVTANLITATFPLASSTLTDNQQFWVKVANTNTGATTFSPNPAVITTPLSLVGQANVALQGGEVVTSGRSLIIYKANTNTFLLAFCSGASPQVPTATKTLHSINLGQATTLANAISNSYSIDVSSTPGLIESNYDSSITTGTILDNQRFWVKVANANPGAVTFTPNFSGGFSPVAVTGMAGSALQGGEIVANSRCCFIWKADTATFYLATSSKGSMQVSTATQTNQATTLGQVLSLLSLNTALQYINSATNVLPGQYECDTVAAPFTVTLPASPAKGDNIRFVDVFGSWLRNNLTINPNGKTIMGNSDNLDCNVRALDFMLIYDGTSWRLF